MYDLFEFFYKFTKLVENDSIENLVSHYALNHISVWKKRILYSGHMLFPAKIHVVCALDAQGSVYRL